MRRYINSSRNGARLIPLNGLNKYFVVENSKTIIFASRFTFFLGTYAKQIVIVGVRCGVVIVIGPVSFSHGCKLALDSTRILDVCFCTREGRFRRVKVSLVRAMLELIRVKKNIGFHSGAGAADHPVLGGELFDFLRVGIVLVGLVGRVVCVVIGLTSLWRTTLILRIVRAVGVVLRELVDATAP